MNRSKEKYQKIPFRHSLKYEFDNLMAKGGLSIFFALILLILISFLIMFFLRVIVGIIMPDATLPNLPEMLWRSLLQIIDAGGVEADEGSHIINKILGIISVSLGLIFFSALVAFISNQFDTKIAQLRQGTSAVLEKGHTLILGFGNQVFEIMEQLILADESPKKSSIVVLSEIDKLKMDDLLKEEIKDRKKAHIITRRGDVSNTKFIKKMSVTEARSIIILNTANVTDPPEIRNQGDARVLEPLLAVVAAAGEDRLPHVVAQLHSDKTKRLAENIVPGKITIIDTNEI